MADGLLSVVLERLASLALQRIEEEVRLMKHVEGDVSKLQRNLKAIQAVLQDAEKKQLSNADVKNWLEQLKDVAHDMDDVLDEWNSHVLKIQIEKEGDEHAPDETKKVCFPGIPSPFSCFKSKVTKLSLHHGIAHKIKELNEKLDVIANEKDRYNLNTTTVDQPVERPKSTSFVDETELFGRDVDEETLASMLLAESSMSQDQRLAVIAIIGMGGIGKTSLAQLAYKDKKVKAHFDVRIWVCVSDPFDEIKIAKAIIEGVEGNTPNISELETLLQHVLKCFETKRFLLVLDDVWSEDQEKWDKLKRPLKDTGATGSRILVTTRKKEVAIVMGAADHMIELGNLSEEHCWSVFERLAFSERKNEECQQFEEIGRKIASRCKGLPLVAKSLGSLMRFKNTIAQWEVALNSELWELKNVDEMFAPFLLSYYDLSSKEKRCFSYCSIFPKDHLIEKDHLIKIWMSQNYLRSEEEGCECFDTLAMRSFFQNFEKNDLDGSITHCKMHDIVHDFAQFLTKDECINLEVDGVEGKILKQLDEKTRHLSLVLGSSAEFPTTLFQGRTKKRNLRTLFIKFAATVDFSLIQELTCLRSLTLSHFWIKTLPGNDIGKLKHLRYLRLNGELDELPDGLCDLCNLQTLDLSFCFRLLRLPKGMGKLVNLRHLYVYSCPKLEGLPKGIIKLRSLRSIDTLIIPENKEEFFDVGDFKSLENLRPTRRFEIGRCRNLGNRDEAEKVDLKNIGQHIDSLVLSFEGKGILEEDSAILEGLEPHQNLRYLCISYYMGPTLSPRWMTSLINLRKIDVLQSENCEMFPSLGKLPLLESIFFLGMHVTKWGLTQRDGEEDSPTKGEIPAKSPITLFPKLKQLEFEFMEEWEKWEEGEGDAAVVTGISSSLNTIMPCLTTLKFYRCTRLRILPDFLKTTTSLKELSITNSHFLEKWCQERTGTEWAKISHAPNIQVRGKYVRKDLVWIKKHNPDLERLFPSE